MNNTITSTWLPASLPDEQNLINVISATGSYLLTDQGMIYDAIASWWCKPLGHCHPLVQSSIYKQLQLFEHHIPANTTNNLIEELSSKLLGIFSTMDKVMYASDGSCAVEIAMKLSYESRVLNGQPKRARFISLNGNYHGETILALSVCGINNYKTNYQQLLLQNYFIDKVPYVLSRNDPLWANCDFDYPLYQQLFTKLAPTTTALIIEPVIQGANGLQIISCDYLSKLVRLAREHDLHIICDEIMVGLGRLGCYSVSKDYLNFEPDIICFAKNLTAGSIPMSAVIINRQLTSTYRKQNKIFPHSHTHSCNALAARVALNYLDYLANFTLLADVLAAEQNLLNLMQLLAQRFSFVINPRAIGAIAACDLTLPKELIDQLFNTGIKYGIYLRPIANTLYLMPPLNNLESEIPFLSEKLIQILNSYSKQIKGI